MTQPITPEEEARICRLVDQIEKLRAEGAAADELAAVEAEIQRVKAGRTRTITGTAGR